MNIINNDDNYKYWRDIKLKSAKTKLSDYIVEISNPKYLKNSEKKQIKYLCANSNFALIQTPQQDDYTGSVVAINQQLGLITADQHLYINNDNLAHITTSNNIKQQEFIPYTTKAINWHTDGYYNTQAQRVRSFSLFCASTALKGGENKWIDNEILYILMREKDQELTKLLSNNDAMTIPEHKINNITRRIKSTGAIFLIDTITNKLYMRYTQRKKNIIFSDEALIAKKLLDEILASDTKYHFSYTIPQSQGIICNNIIHNRSSFIDDKNNPRLMLRARYFNRV